MQQDKSRDKGFSSKGHGKGLTRRKFLVRSAGVGGGTLLGLFTNPTLRTLRFPAAYAAGTPPSGGGTPVSNATETTIPYSDCFDLETETITSSPCSNGDFLFGQNSDFTPNAVLIWNTTLGVVGAYTTTAYGDVDLSHAESLTLGANVNQGFNKVAVIKTGGTHYKLGFVSETSGASPDTVTFLWEPLV